MKLTLVLLTFCLLYVSVSHQQQQQFMPRQRSLPLNYYYNSAQQLSRNNWMRQAPYYLVPNNYISSYFPPNTPFNEHIPSMNQMDEGVGDDYTSDDDFNEGALGRIPFQGLRNKVVDNNNNARLFFGNILRTITTTVLSTVTSTFTSTSVATCAPAAQFLGGAAATACRRRRSVDQIAFAAVVTPSQVQPLEVSVAPPTIREVRDLSAGPTVSPSSAEIESTQQQIHDENNLNTHLSRPKRALFTSSFTLTITSYSISTVTSTKSITLATAGVGVACAACVQCLPSGISICK